MKARKIISRNQWRYFIHKDQNFCFRWCKNKLQYRYFDSIGWCLSSHDNLGNSKYLKKRGWAEVSVEKVLYYFKIKNL